MLRKTLLLFSLVLPSAVIAATLPLQNIKVPQGFHISIYARNVPGARQMALGKNGVVYVGTRTGNVYAVLPEKNFSEAREVITLAKNLDAPNGVAVRDGDLYVAEISRILRYDNIAEHLKNSEKPAVAVSHLSKQTRHAPRVIHFGPDGLLYVSIGMPCNTCLPANKHLGSIIRMQANGKDKQVFAKGIRNSVGFAWSPKTNILWFSDNGQDWLGNNLPPDEINRAPSMVMNFGFPYFYGNNVPAPKYGTMRSSKGMTPPVYDLPAHVAPLGIMFYSGNMFPKKYRNQLFVAEHGSWNRSSKVGYQVVSLQIKNAKVISAKPFASGWLQKQNFWGRPVALLQLPDGSLLISDDYAGVIYRIRYKKPSWGLSSD